MVPVKVTAAKATVRMMRRHFWRVSALSAAAAAGSGAGGGDDDLAAAAVLLLGVATLGAVAADAAFAAARAVDGGGARMTDGYLGGLCVVVPWFRVMWVAQSVNPSTAARE
jgi:hypothetical protein